MSKLKIVGVVVVALLLAWVGYGFYNYFFDISPPRVEMKGIEKGGHYAGDVQCTIAGSDSYNVSDVSVWLDVEPLVKGFVINKKKFEYVFPVATRALSEGEHLIKVLVKDSSFRRNPTKMEVPFVVDNVQLRAMFVTTETIHKIFQGKTLHLQFQTNKPIKEAYVELFSKRHDFLEESPNSNIYECFIPISTEESPNEHIFTIKVIDKVGNLVPLVGKLQVIMYPFKKQKLVMKEKQADEEEEEGISSKQFEEELGKLSENSPRRKLWKGTFYVPCDMKGITTCFGTLRTTQEYGKYRHNGIDILVEPRSVVWAAADGVLVVKDKYVRGGNTVVIDHGLGVLSKYLHLEKFAEIEVGEKIKKGKPIGAVGKTGYATGYHLHWEIRVNNIPVDPMQWTKHDF